MRLPTQPKSAITINGGNTASLTAFLAGAIALVGTSTSAGQLKKAKADHDARATPLLSQVVPEYFYANGPDLREWDRLIATAPVVPIVAIINPASGLGKGIDKNIAAAITRARTGEVTVVGYITEPITQAPTPTTACRLTGKRRSRLYAARAR
jgi:hypothetical protein